jgi:hypothetical protein
VETSPTFAGANVRSLAVTYVGYGLYTGWYGEFQQKGGTENFKNWGGTEKGLFRTRNKPFSVHPTRLCENKFLSSLGSPLGVTNPIKSSYFGVR